MNSQRATLKRLKAALGAALLSLVPLIAPAQTQTSPPPTEDPRESLLQLLRERNIFNPNRRGPVREDRERTPTDPEPQREAFQLIGALTTPDQHLAFFDGSDPDYRRVINIGEVIAGFKVTAISTTSVQLEHETNQIEVAVGTGLERVGDSPWKTASTPARSASPTISESSATTDPASSNSTEGTPTGNGEENDVLKRLLERRRQEESQ
ncbi:MAG: hypothetical protein ACO34E_03610 [Limisphaerales bacterium]|jgi:hypothetical protein